MASLASPLWIHGRNEPLPPPSSALNAVPNGRPDPRVRIFDCVGLMKCDEGKTSIVKQSYNPSNLVQSGWDMIMLSLTETRLMPVSPNLEFSSWMRFTPWYLSATK